MQSNHALHFSSSSIHVLLWGLQSLTPCLGRYLSHKRITYQIKKTHTLELGTDERSFGIALCGSAASSRPPNVWYWHSAWRHLTPWPSINSSLCHQTSSFALPVSAQLPLHQATRVTVLFTKQKRPQESSGCHGWLSGKKEKTKTNAAIHGVSLWRTDSGRAASLGQTSFFWMLKHSSLSLSRANDQF